MRAALSSAATWFRTSSSDSRTPGCSATALSGMLVYRCDSEDDVEARDARHKSQREAEVAVLFN